jgi:hypothetical protein
MNESFVNDDAGPAARLIAVELPCGHRTTDCSREQGVLHGRCQVLGCSPHVQFGVLLRAWSTGANREAR